DTDVDNSIDVTSIVITTDATYGTVVDNGNGTVDYTHNGYTAYSDSFQYTIDDVLGATSNTATVTVSINELGSHASEPFIPVVTGASWRFSTVDYTNYGLMTFDECQEKANVTGTQYYVGIGSDHGLHGWIGDHDETQATVSTGYWPTEGIVARDSQQYCVLGRFAEHYQEATESPTAEEYTDSKGRKWTYWEFTSQYVHQALAFADDHQARIINPNSVGLTGALRATPPTHWNFASAQFNGGGDYNTSYTAPITVGYYELPTMVVDGFSGFVGPDMSDDGYLQCEGYYDTSANDDLTVDWGDDCVDVDHNKVRLVCGADVDSYRYVDVNKNPFRDDFDASPEYDRILAAKDQDGTDFTVDSNTVSATGMNPNLGASWWGGENGCSDLNMVNVSPGSGCGGGLEVDSCFGQLSGLPRHFYVYVKVDNDDPVANDDTATVDMGSTVVIDVIDNDTDDGILDGTIEIGDSPDYGSLADNADGTVDYTHNGTENFSDSFTYRVQDAEGAWSNFATVTITIIHAPESHTFNYTGSQQTLAIPAWIDEVTIEVWGAEGTGSGSNPGKGGYAKGVASGVNGQTLYFFTGGQFKWNGGGDGPNSSDGGDASDVRLGGTGLGNRIIVAGGGGGGVNSDVADYAGGGGGSGICGSNYCGGGGGAGYGGAGGNGGVSGGTGITNAHGGGAGGGGLNSGGNAACATWGSTHCGTNGSLGMGGAGDSGADGICYNSYGGTAGGGSGYYGGGGSAAGQCGSGGGGGGSSWTGTLSNPVMTGG
ncbi:MAG: hypothetical protein HN348_25780, partial [Proteobacteria bacterium]|nr:hypothetical protein [Pseudomonadota bacterium]